MLPKRIVLAVSLFFALTAPAQARHHHHKHHPRVEVRRLEPATPWEEAWLAAGDKEWEEAEAASPTHRIILPATPL